MIDGPPLYYDREGNPVSLEGWAFLFENENNSVAVDKLPDGVVVSTVWIGINANIAGYLLVLEGAADADQYRPHIFETMIFGGEYDLLSFRYPDEASAQDGHMRIVRDLKSGNPPFFEKVAW